MYFYEWPHGGAVVLFFLNYLHQKSRATLGTNVPPVLLLIRSIEGTTAMSVKSASED